MKYQNFEKKNWKIVQKTKSEINPHRDSHWGTQNQMRMENYPQCATQCATQWDSQNHMKRAKKVLKTCELFGLVFVLVLFEGHYIF